MEEHNTATTITTSKNDEDGARDNVLAELGHTVLTRASERLGDNVDSVESAVLRIRTTLGLLSLGGRRLLQPTQASEMSAKEGHDDVEMSGYEWRVRHES